jgi:Tol biopolymer transport system component
MWKAFACLSFSVVLLAHFPPSRRIAFVREHTEGLYLLDYGSGRSHTLDVGMSNVQGLAYSAKAALLAFEGSKDEDEPPALYVFHLKDRRRELIHKASEDDILYRPAFDPDGNHVYAVNYSRGIFRYTLAKKTWDRVPVSGGGAVLNPQMLAFSKTGKKVAISPAHFQGFLIARVVGGGFVLEQHLLTDFRSCTSPQWIGDQAIVFAGRREEGPQYLWRLNLGSGGGVTQLTHPPMYTRDFLSLSADETTVVFTGSDTKEPLAWRLWQISVDGAGLRQLTRGGYALYSHLWPVWIE